MHKVVASKADSAEQVFTRRSEAEALSLASELEKEGYTILINGKTFLNSAGPNGLYLHQAGTCSLCGKGSGCGRCKNTKGEYYSVKPTHYHSRRVEGISGHAGVHDILCYDCHRKDRFMVYGEGYGEAVA